MLDEDEVKSAPPEPPQHLPETLQVKWREIYAKAHARAQKDFDYESPTFQRQMALREANRLQEVEEPKSYEDAMKLQPHEFIHRQVGKRVVDTMNELVRLELHRIFVRLRF